jgi:ABC-type transport system involved in multi-copper enzyme maturation permease subunit
LLSTPGQWRAVAIGVVAVLLSFGLVYVPGYFAKYLLLARLPDPGLYRAAMRADILDLILLAMTLIGLCTAIEWHSLFPGLRDYLCLASLPIRMRDVFAAKFTALLAFALTLTVATNLLPSLLLPIMFAGPYAGDAAAQVPAIFFSSSLAALFVFFALVAIQGVLLNTVPLRQFGRVSLAVQGALLTVLLCGLPLALQLATPRAMDRPPSWVALFPPAWFLGLDQVVAGNREPLAVHLAAIAVAALAASAGASLGTYWWSCARHRKRLVEAVAPPAVSSSMMGSRLAAGCMARDPREFGVFAFIAKTLARSPLQRTVLTVFVAIAAALIGNGFVSLYLSFGLHRSFAGTLAFRQAALDAPLALSFFVLLGLRYLFRLPVEHRANWIFRINQAGNEPLFFHASERFLLWCAVVPIALLTLPIEIRALGPGAGLVAATLCLLPSLILMEALLMQSRCIPFTSLYLPGQRPVIQLLLFYSAAISLYITLPAALIEASLSRPRLAVCLFAVL